MSMFTQDSINPGQPWAVKIQRLAIDAFFPITAFMDEKLASNVTLPDGANAYSWPLMDQPNITDISSIEATPGIMPADVDEGFTQVTVKPRQFIEVTHLSDVVLADAPIDLIPNTIKNKAGALAVKCDKVIQAKLNEGVNVIYAGGAASRGAIASTSILNVQEVAKARVKLQNGASPVFSDGSYAGVVSTGSHFDLLTNGTVGQFLEVAKYSQPEKFFRGEVGKMLNVRIIVSNNLVPFAGAGASGQNVWPSYFMGQEAFGIVEKEPLQVIVKPLGSAGSADAANQQASVSVKIRFNVALLKPQSLWRVESSTSFE